MKKQGFLKTRKLCLADYYIKHVFPQQNYKSTESGVIPMFLRLEDLNWLMPALNKLGIDDFSKAMTIWLRDGKIEGYFTLYLAFLNDSSNQPKVREVDGLE